MTQYVSDADFDAYVRDETGSTTITVRQRANLAGQRAIEEFCKRSFSVASETATDRSFVPDGSNLLRIHDCTEVSAVVSNGVTIAAAAYQLEPVSVSWSGQTRPYDRVRLYNSTFDVIYPGKASVVVTAKWGWAAVPAEVIEATLIMGKDILQQRDTVGNMAAVGDFGGMIRQNIYVRQLLSPLRSLHSFGVG